VLFRSIYVTMKVGGRLSSNKGINLPGTEIYTLSLHDALPISG